MSAIDRIHLDPVGGIAGDMFVAALCDAFPEHVPGMLAELAKLSNTGARYVPGTYLSQTCPGTGTYLAPVGRAELRAHTDGILRGQRFYVEDPAAGGEVRSAHDHGDGHAHDHLHVPHRAIRTTLQCAGLEPATLRHALGLFALLAEAEGAIHGVDPDDVAFHEVGAWDSFVDFVAAAYLIAKVAPRAWTVGPLPLGGGRVKTQHGILPLPAPATAWLLQGQELVDDGVAGERVTPTGATIVRYLCGEPHRTGEASRPFAIATSGHGFGTMTLRGIPNVLRVIAFAEVPALPQPLDEEIAALEFEVDDQSAEDLAVALERLRAAEGVLDASQAPVVGKKGRLATRVQVLARLDAADAIADLCLAQTTTLGVRIARMLRRVAPRASMQTADGVRVKVASRPSGAMTAKAEMDDLARVPGGRAEREEARRRAEDEALRATSHDDRRCD